MPHNSDPIGLDPSADAVADRLAELADTVHSAKLRAATRAFEADDRTLREFDPIVADCKLTHERALREYRRVLSQFVADRIGAAAHPSPSAVTDDRHLSAGRLREVRAEVRQVVPDDEAVPDEQAALRGFLDDVRAGDGPDAAGTRDLDRGDPDDE